MRMLTHILAALLAIASWSCGAGHDSRLERADALVCADPLRALGILDSIDAATLSDPDRAWFALLRAKASDKSYRHIGNDSLIGFAAEYFAGRGDSLEVQALYYQGYGLSQKGEIDRALIPLHEAYDCALKTGDSFYAGMAAREQARIYGLFDLSEKEREWALEAKDLFGRIGRNTHAAWMDLIVLESMIGAGEYDQAHVLADSLINVDCVADPYFRQQLMSGLAEIYDGLGEPEMVTETYAKMRNLGMELNAEDWCRIADNLLKLDHIAEAEKALGKAQEVMTENSDTLYTGYVATLIAGAAGDYKAGYEKAASWSLALMNAADHAVTMPRTLLLADYLDLSRRQERIAKERNLLRWELTMAGCMVLLLIAALAYQRSVNARRELRRRSEQHIQAIEELESKLGGMKKADNESIKTLSQVMAVDSEMGAVLSRIAKGGAEEVSKARLNAIMIRLRSESFTDELAAAIDSLHDNWATDLRRLCPAISASQYRLALYLYLGLSSASIMQLLEKPSSGAFFTSKNRLKKLLGQNLAGGGDRFLRDIGM